MRLFRVTRAARLSNAIDQYGHRVSRFRAGIDPPMILTVADWVPQAVGVLAQTVFPGSEGIKPMAGPNVILRGHAARVTKKINSLYFE
jgi:hypothetical protein